MKKNKRKFNWNLVIRIILGILGISLLAVVIFRKSIFPPESFMANLYEAEQDSLLSVKIIRSIIIIIATICIYQLLKLIVKFLITKSERAKTAADIILSILKYVAAIIVILMILKACGVDTSAIVTSAGILSLVIGLGCQSLISDIVSGLFIIFEGDFLVGDVVVISGWRGTVQSIGIRTTKIIDASGNVKIINNSHISDIVNNTKELSVAICTCGIEYGDSIERVENIISSNLDDMRKRITAIVEGPFYKGVEELGDSAVVLKLVAKCHEEDKYQVQRDMNRELKIIFDKNNVSIPFPQVVVNKPTTFEEVTKEERNVANQFVSEQKKLSKNISDEQNN